MHFKFTKEIHRKYIGNFDFRAFSIYCVKSSGYNLNEYQISIVLIETVLLIPILLWFVTTQSNSKGCRPKKNSIFVDIVQIGGRKVNPMSKNLNEIIFWHKLEREGVTKHIVKNRSTLFSMIQYSIWPIKVFEGCLHLKNPFERTMCLPVCTPDPQKVIGIIETVSFKA